jgi:Uncharacterized protein conserved in bacteria
MHQLWIIAGPNGSGKTTLAQRHLAGRLPVLNPDEIALEIDRRRPQAPDVALQAGREALTRQRRLLAARHSFALETTFSGNRELALMRDAKAAGYKVNLVFVCLDSPQISMGRIALRVNAGGHHVPGADVQRRLANLPEGLALADRAWLLDNTHPRMRLIASLEKGTVKSMTNALPRWVKTARLPALEQAQGLSL